MYISEKEVHDSLKGIISPDITEVVHIRRILRKNERHKSVAPLLAKANVRHIANIAHSVIVQKSPMSTFNTSEDRSRGLVTFQSIAPIQDPAVLKPVLNVQPDNFLIPGSTPVSGNVSKDCGNIENSEEKSSTTTLTVEIRVKGIQLLEYVLQEELTNKVNMPYRVQHQALAKMQEVLEHACFDFAQRYHPHILEKHEWTCADSAELHIMVKELWRRPILPAETFVMNEGLRDSICDIRHSAVHRLHRSISQYDQMFKASSLLLCLMKDQQRREIMAHLCNIVMSALIKLNRDEDRITSALQVRRMIQEHQEELGAQDGDLVKAAEDEKEVLRRLAADNMARALEQWTSCHFATDIVE